VPALHPSRSSISAPAPRSRALAVRSTHTDASCAPTTFISYSESAASRITTSTDSPS